MKTLRCKTAGCASKLLWYRKNEILKHRVNQMRLLVFSMYVTYYFILFEFISAKACQHEFKKVLYDRQIISISFLLKWAISS